MKVIEEPHYLFKVTMEEVNDVIYISARNWREVTQKLHKKFTKRKGNEIEKITVLGDIIQ